MFSDLRDAYFDSSTLNNVAGNFNVYHGNKDTVLNILKNHVAAGALHNSGERFDSPKCHPGTRIAVLKKIGDWYRNKEASTPHVMWLYGAAGAGKSSIAQSMAEECHKLHTLAASFFFSRTAPGRNNSNRLMATIAYQVAQEISDTQPHIQQAIEKDPMIFSKSMETQLHHLVVEPLLHLVNSNSSIDESWPKLFIIDGLDECNGRETQQAIIHCFASALTQQTLPLYVLISSRSEQPIREVFSQPDRHWEYTPLVLDHEYQPDEDIALFLKANFSKIRSTHALKGSLPETWPSDSDIEALVQKSSGQFIFASTVMRYIRSPRHQPIHRLETILGLRRCGGPTPFAELDALYMHILQATEEDQYDTIMRIFGLLVCKGSGFLTYRMDKQSEIEGFLNLEFGHIYLALADCYSIVHLPPPEAGKSQVIRFLHASMSDFLLDPDRSHRFYLDQGKVHADLVRACIRGVGSLSKLF
ncbi:hypothetical protein BDZ94DRAFT_1308314 [Collybia nuda]|uniref:Nephrocystin 3-like N-terminal domain-containing protein n=1 Tax=Collybia nuda TaxID=64659 RepID=A0A9P5YAC3_9AGAR|nr:hypothetical protein BDZ94DRAFT_1308314 [Collybia nuda]